MYVRHIIIQNETYYISSIFNDQTGDIITTCENNVVSYCTLSNARSLFGLFLSNFIKSTYSTYSFNQYLTDITYSTTYNIDDKHSFYGFIYKYNKDTGEDICVGHSKDSSFVGKSLQNGLISSGINITITEANEIQQDIINKVINEGGGWLINNLLGTPTALFLHGFRFKGKEYYIGIPLYYDTPSYTTKANCEICTNTNTDICLLRNAELDSSYTMVRTLASNDINTLFNNINYENSDSGMIKSIIKETDLTFVAAPWATSINILPYVIGSTITFVENLINFPYLSLQIEAAKIRANQGGGWININNTIHGYVQRAYINGDLYIYSDHFLSHTIPNIREIEYDNGNCSMYYNDECSSIYIREMLGYVSSLLLASSTKEESQNILNHINKFPSLYNKKGNFNFMIINEDQIIKSYTYNTTLVNKTLDDYINLYNIISQTSSNLYDYIYDITLDNNQGSIKIIWDKPTIITTTSSSEYINLYATKVTPIYVTNGILTTESFYIWSYYYDISSPTLYYNGCPENSNTYNTIDSVKYCTCDTYYEPTYTLHSTTCEGNENNTMKCILNPPPCTTDDYYYTKSSCNIYNKQKISYYYYTPKICDESIGISKPKNKEINGSTVSTNTYYGIISYIFSIISMMISFFFLRWVIKYKDIRLIKAAQPLFCTFIIIGCLCINISSLLLFNEQTTLHCEFYLWILNLSYTITIGSIITKTYRVFIIFYNKRFKRIIFKNKDVIKWLICFIAIDIFILSIYNINDPYIIKKEIKWSNDLSYSYIDKSCNRNLTFEYLLIFYKIIITIIACLLSYKTGNLHDAFAESSHIFFATYNIAVISFILICINFISINNDLKYLFLSLGISICSSLVTIIIFLPKYLCIKENGLEYDPFKDNLLSSPRNNISSNNNKELIVVSPSPLSFSFTPRKFFTISPTNKKKKTNQVLPEQKMNNEINDNIENNEKVIIKKKKKKVKNKIYKSSKIKINICW